MNKKEKTDIFEQNLFKENEESANHYTVRSLTFAAAICVLVWLLNIFNFFIVDDTLMNIVMPVSIVLLLIPLALERSHKVPGNVLRYILFIFFVLVITVISIALPRHTILAWACPIILACHYYSPKFARFALIVTLVMMLAAFFGGIFFGEWDRNVLGNFDSVEGLEERLDFLEWRRANGALPLMDALSFYYLPRAGIVVIVYMICISLSKRTNSLLVRQDEAVRENSRISTELNVANHIQTSMLPGIFPAFPETDEFDIFASMTPAKEVGGDFYDFFMVDDRHLAVVMADVSGKGVPAALFMVIGKTLIKDHTVAGRDLGEVFTKVNSMLCESNSEGLFITAFEGVLDLDTGEFVYVNAGHEPPYIYKEDGTMVELEMRRGFVLAGLETTKYKQGKTVLEKGDKFFHYTDGVTEATDSTNRLFGSERLRASVVKNAMKAPKEMLSGIKRDIDDFVGEAAQFDDITMLCLEYKK